MKKLLTSILAIGLIAQFGWAQSTPQTPKDPKAKAILDKLSAKTKTYQTITTDFTFRLVNKGEGLDDKQSGKLIVRDNKYKLLMKEQDIISNGTTVWTHIKGDINEVQISEVEEDEEDDVFLNPKKIFTIYESGFKYVLDAPATNNGKQCEVIRLYPEKPGDKPYHTIILYIDKNKTEISSIEIKSKDGNNFIYVIENMVVNKSYPTTFFEFKVPEGAEINDLRD